MIFSLLLTIIFLFMAVYCIAFIHHKTIRFSLCLMYVAGIFFVWMPSITSDIAAFFGIGRGLDFFFILLFVAILNANVLLARHLNTQHRALTKITRYLAIQNASFKFKNLGK